MTIVGTLEAELKADPAIWEAAMKRATESMEGLARKVELSSQKIKQSNKAADEAAGALQRLHGNARSVGEQVSKIGAVTGGMGAAFSSAVPQMQGAVSAAAGLAQAFATGGPLLAGIALVGTAVGVFVSKLSAMRKEADKVAKAFDDIAEAKTAAAGRALDELVEQERLIRTLQLQVLSSPKDYSKVATQQSIANKSEDLDQKRKELAGIRSEIAGIEASAARISDAAARDALRAGVVLKAGAMALTPDETRNLATLREAERKAEDEIRRESKKISNLELINALEEQKADNAERYAKAQAEAEKALERSAKRSNARTIAELTPMQQVAFDAGNIEMLNVLLGEGGTALERFAMSLGGDPLSVLKQLLDAKDASDGLADSLPKVSKTLREIMDEADQRAVKNAANAADGIGAIGSGAVGTLALTTAGTIAGDSIAGPPGAMVGQALGGLLGPLADKLAASMGVLDPLMQALGTVVSGLAPIFGLLGGMIRSLVVPVLDLLAPVVLAVSQACAAFGVPLLRIAQVLLPFFATQIAILVPIVELLSDVFVALVEFIDTYVFMPIATAAVELYNAIVNAVNGIVAGINGFLGAVGLAAISFGYLDRMERPESMLDMGVSQQALIDGLDDNTDALRDFSRSLTNLPSGYRYALTEYRSEDANGFGGNRREMSRGGGIVINGPVNVMARDANVLEAIRRNMRERGVPFGGPIASAPPRRN